MSPVWGRSLSARFCLTLTDGVGSTFVVSFHSVDDVSPSLFHVRLHPARFVDRRRLWADARKGCRAAQDAVHRVAQLLLEDSWSSSGRQVRKRMASLTTVVGCQRTAVGGSIHFAAWAQSRRSAAWRRQRPGLDGERPRCGSWR